MLKWQYIVLFILTSHAVLSTSHSIHTSMHCYTPFSTRMKKSYQNFLDFTANDEASLLVFESNDLVFNNTNIDISPGIYPCMEKDGDCEYGTFDIVYNEGISESLEKQLNTMIFQKHLNPGDKTSYRLLTNGQYCIYYYDYNNEHKFGEGNYFSQVAQGKRLSTLKYSDSFKFNGLTIEQEALLIADIIASIFELVLIVILRRKLRESSINSDSINQIPFKFMINLLTLEVIKNLIEISSGSYIYFSDLDRSSTEFSTHTEILRYGRTLKVIIDYFKTFTLYHFIALNKAVLVPSNWEIKEILSHHRFFFLFSIFKATSEISNVYGYNVSSKLMDYDVLEFWTRVIMIGLYYYKSQITEHSLHDSFKVYSRCFRYSRVFVLPSLIAYSSLMWVLCIIVRIYLRRSISSIYSENLDESQSLFEDLEFFWGYSKDLTLYCIKRYYKLTLPLMVTLMSYIWKEVLVSEPVSIELNTLN